MLNRHFPSLIAGMSAYIKPSRGLEEVGELSFSWIVSLSYLKQDFRLPVITTSSTRIP